ncbi:ShlB/FhaC/HecB family hemolysin secretion/activation protein [Janthinobacterium fluminis]|uniref:ShlB/FhaC/HecB family hemolysin secretion/activation protein n=1 Tax=Janthinobacterium fluminis TaxID=2987524 RepID=A0ABT5K5P8_9BURK|nr:ShlB/FhaC/HecB family hemolysin secretion/activation protein [Janthinobacterium fluminis]MDC8760327.1 ShlB/FhaC/HecB family hemolysin secretion/activation protein [Janthinobacterium fluminis]
MAAAIWAWLPAAYAQSGAGAAGANQEFLRQQERERIVRQQQQHNPDVRSPTAGVAEADRLPEAETPCFAVARIVLEGDSSEQFQWALAAANRGADGKADAAPGRCLGTAGINILMRRVQNAILKRGYVTTRVLVGPQDLSGGTLKLGLVPGRVRAVRFAPGSDGRATRWNAVPAAPGDLLNLRDTEQALENFKRVPTAEADIQIAPAEGGDGRPGDSDLVVQWHQGFPFRLSVSADDSGSAATGKYQGGLTLSYDNWWTLNDLFYISLNRNLHGAKPAGHGTEGMVVHYSLPFGYWLLALSTSSGGYRQQVAGTSQTYLYRGSSRNGDVKLSRLVYRDAARKTTVSLRGWMRASQNFIDDTEVEVQRRRTAGWELGLAHKEFLGAATLDANLNYRRGTGALGSLAAPEEAFGEGSSRAALFTADANLNAPFKLGGLQLKYTGAWRMQVNRTPLVPQDRFAIGGRYTVRGYDGESSLSAERGWVLRNELGVTLGGSGHECYVALDHGEVAGPSSEFLLDKRLSGVALGLRGQLWRVQYEVFFGRPLRKPERFQSAASTAGFSSNMSF